MQILCALAARIGPDRAGKSKHTGALIDGRGSRRQVALSVARRRQQRPPVHLCGLSWPPPLGAPTAIVRRFAPSRARIRPTLNDDKLELAIDCVP